MDGVEPGMAGKPVGRVSQMRPHVVSVWPAADTALGAPADGAVDVTGGVDRLGEAVEAGDPHAVSRTAAISARPRTRRFMRVILPRFADTAGRRPDMTGPVVPRHLGGSLRDPSNLRTLCSECNLAKGASLATDAEVLRARTAARGAVPSAIPARRTAYGRPAAIIDRPVVDRLTFPYHVCDADPVPVLIGDMTPPRWTGPGCPPGCPRATSPDAA